MDAVAKEPKKKRVLVAAACDYCRRLHEKCDGADPCGRCQRRGKECTYSEESQKKRKIAPASLAAPAATMDLATDPAAISLRENSQYRSKAMRLVQATLMLPDTDGALLAKFQCSSSFVARFIIWSKCALQFLSPCESFLARRFGAEICRTACTFAEGLSLMPSLEIPDARFLPKALGPCELIETAEDLMAAAEHLVILSLGARFFVLETLRSVLFMWPASLRRSIIVWGYRIRCRASSKDGCRCIKAAHGAP